METMISFGSFFWTFFGEKLINYEETSSNEETNLYSMDIAIKIKLYLMIQIISSAVLFILSFIFMYERKNYIALIQNDKKSEDLDSSDKAPELVSNSDLSENILKKDENINYEENTIDSVGKKNFNNNDKEEKIDIDINKDNKDDDNDNNLIAR